MRNCWQLRIVSRATNLFRRSATTTTPIHTSSFQLNSPLNTYSNTQNNKDMGIVYTLGAFFASGLGSRVLALGLQNKPLHSGRDFPCILMTIILTLYMHFIHYWKTFILTPSLPPTLNRYTGNVRVGGRLDRRRPVLPPVAHQTGGAVRAAASVPRGS